jgi:hypothetical protein
MKRIGSTLSVVWLIFLAAGDAFSQTAPAPAKPAVAPRATPAASPKAPQSKQSPANPADKSKPPAATDALSVDQARLADRFKRLEEVIGRLAELSASSDPRRAKLLREALSQSRGQDINLRFESTVKLLQDERLAAAATNQTELQKELDGLLALLLKADRDKELTSQRERIRKYLKELDRLIRLQKGIRARTDGGDGLPDLGADQQRLADETGKLGGDIAKTEGDKKTGSDEVPKNNKNSSPKSDDTQKPKADDKAKPKAAEQQKPGETEKPKPDETQKPKSNDQKKSPGQPSGKSEQAPKPADSSKQSKPNEAPQSAKPKSDKGQPSGGQSPKQSKPNDSPPSNSPPSQGKPGDQSPEGNNSDQQQNEQSQDPGDRAAKKLRSAEDRMKQAKKKLDETQRKGATEEQRKAERELEQAKAELERILRQLREEELERTLMQLAARFRKMLEMQTAIYEGTMRLDKIPEKLRTHDHEIESARLSRQESQILVEVEKALLLLHEEGSSVAFPEAIEQMRDDMRQVTERLAALKVEKITQGLEKDIIAALEEAIGTLEQSLKDLEKKKTPKGQQPAAGDPDEMPLVDKIAELKMIRSLQLRINKRTQRYGEMIEGEQAETPDLLKALDGLADRQQRVYKATADLQHRRND